MYLAIRGSTCIYVRACVWCVLVIGIGGRGHGGKKHAIWCPCRQAIHSFTHPVPPRALIIHAPTCFATRVSMSRASSGRGWPCRTSSAATLYSPIPPSRPVPLAGLLRLLWAAGCRLMLVLLVLLLLWPTTVAPPVPACWLLAAWCSCSCSCCSCSCSRHACGLLLLLLLLSATAHHHTLPSSSVSPQAAGQHDLEIRGRRARPKPTRRPPAFEPPVRGWLPVVVEWRLD